MVTAAIVLKLRSLDDGTPLVTRCGFCKKLELEDGIYTDDYSLVPVGAQFSDTYCIPCIRVKFPAQAHLFKGR